MRLAHLNADHGLVRLMQWARPAGEGLGMAPFRCLGARWVTTVTADAWNILNHAEVLAASGAPIRIYPPVFTASHYKAHVELQPFAEEITGLREDTYYTPLDRRVLLERSASAGRTMAASTRARCSSRARSCIPA